MFAIIQGVVSEARRPEVRTIKIRGEEVKQLSFLLNTNQRIKRENVQTSVMVYLNSNRMDRMLGYLYGGRKIEVRGDLTVSIEERTQIDRDGEQDTKHYLRLNLRAIENPVFLTEEPIGAAKGMLEMMRENGIITEEQQNEFSQKVETAIRNKGVVKSNKSTQQEKQAAPQADEPSNANDLSSFDPEEVDDKDIPV